jgi:hypothetical protein
VLYTGEQFHDIRSPRVGRGRLTAGSACRSRRSTTRRAGSRPGSRVRHALVTLRPGTCPPG